MWCTITNAKMLNQKEAGVVLRREKHSKQNTRLDYCLSAKLMIGAGCQLWEGCWRMACHPEPSHPFHAKAPVNAQLGLADYVADALSQLINKCFTFMDTKDQIILTFFIADEINYWI